MQASLRHPVLFPVLLISTLLAVCPPITQWRWPCLQVYCLSVVGGTGGEAYTLGCCSLAPGSSLVFVLSYIGASAHECSVCGGQRGQQILSPLELELQGGCGAVSCLTSVLGATLKASGRTVLCVVC